MPVIGSSPACAGLPRAGSPPWLGSTPQRGPGSRCGRPLGPGRRLQRAMGPPVGNRTGCPLLLAGHPRGPVPPQSTGTTRSPTSTRRRSSSSSRRSRRCRGRRSWRSGRPCCSSRSASWRVRACSPRACSFRSRSMEVAGGNVSLLLAAAIVVGFRWPAAWSIVLLTKLTPGIGLLWFAVRREWRALAIALGVTAAIAAISFAILPDQWRTWLDVIDPQRRQGRDLGVGSGAILDPPADRDRDRRLGRPDRPPLDRAGRVDARRCRLPGSPGLDAAGGDPAPAGTKRTARAPRRSP